MSLTLVFEDDALLHISGGEALVVGHCLINGR
jgi:hypothetical protein